MAASVEDLEIFDDVTIGLDQCTIHYTKASGMFWLYRNLWLCKQFDRRMVLAMDSTKRSQRILFLAIRPDINDIVVETESEEEEEDSESVGTIFEAAEKQKKRSAKRKPTRLPSVLNNIRRKSYRARISRAVRKKLQLEEGKSVDLCGRLFPKVSQQAQRKSDTLLVRKCLQCEIKHWNREDYPSPVVMRLYFPEVADLNRFIETIWFDRILEPRREKQSILNISKRIPDHWIVAKERIQSAAHLLYLVKHCDWSKQGHNFQF